MIDRRSFIVASTAAVFGFGVPERPSTLPTTADRRLERMYGLIGKAVAVAGRRDELAAILLDGASDMPGCLSYVVAEDAKDEDALWVTEVWESEASHQASLSLPSVQEAIRKGRPLIAGFGERVVTRPVGGRGEGLDAGVDAGKRR